MVLNIVLIPDICLSLHFYSYVFHLHRTMVRILNENLYIKLSMLGFFLDARL